MHAVQDSALWRLDGTSTSIIILHDTGVPVLYWFGNRLADDIDAALLTGHDDSALAYGGGDQVTRLTLFPEASLGYTGSPALAGFRSRGGFAHRFETVGVDVDEGRLRFDLQDAVVKLAASIELVLDQPNDVLTFITRITNTGTAPYTIDWLASATLPLPSHHSEVLSHHGRWGLENQACRRTIGPGRLDISNLHGRTSHEHSPGLITGSTSFNEDSGDVLFAQLAWSGNFSMRVERLNDGTGYLQAGVLLLPGEGTLEPGESFEAPAFVCTRGHGMNTCTQRFHRHLRQQILPRWTREARPIHANSWEALYFRHDVSELIELVDAAATVGAERFVLDDGWFLHRRNDRAGLGDWYVDESIYPDGLTPIVERVRAHGMQFGLWFEPEMVNPDSDLFRRHPDWALHHEGLATPLARSQLPLDLARDDVQQYLFDRIVSLVHEYAIDYIKWDLNRGLVLAGDGTTGRAARQPPALYRLLSRILQACPDLEIETCASGGARADLGILRKTGRVWASDNIDPIERASIQQSFLRFLPPEIMGAHVGHKTAHLTGRVTDLHTRAIVALQGQFGFELDARVLDEDDVAVLAFYTELYKRSRGWLADATYWQLPTNHDSLLASALVSADRQRGWFFVTATASVLTTRTGLQNLRGLERSQRYRLSLASANVEELQPFNRITPAWCRQPIETTGELLMDIGVPLPVMAPQTALLIGIERAGERTP